MTAAPVFRDYSATSRLGITLAAVGALGFGLMITASRMTYEAGSNPVTLICARAGVPALIIAVVMLLRGGSFAIVPGAGRAVAGVILGQLGITIGYLSAVAYIPVSLAVLVFYAYPVLVAALLALTRHSRVGWTATLAFAAAFAGLTLALAPSFASLDPRGLAFALCATAAGTLLLLAADRLPPHQRMLPVCLYANLATLGLAVPYALITGSLAAPQGVIGWSSLTFVCLAYLAAFFAMIGAVRHAGPLRTALVFNLEPVIAILSAVALLGETLGPFQTLGAALVIGALVLATLAERPSPPLPPPA
jgi:drug/metabolite transporter (DMT)-like permease